MYTELIFGASLKKETPKEIIDILDWMINSEDLIKSKYPETPEHEFFKCERWKYLFKMSSYYFGVSDSHSSMWRDSLDTEWIISTRSNIKNYDSEIEKFIDWIKPWISGGSGYRDMYAISIYEESDEPTIYYLDEQSD